MVGVANTLRVALLGIIFTTLLGTLLGVGRFSRNALVRALCSTYVEVFRNIPILLQLLMWYLLFTEVLPDAAEAWQVGSVYLIASCDSLSLIAADSCCSNVCSLL